MRRHKRRLPLLIFLASLIALGSVASWSAGASDGEGLFTPIQAVEASELEPATLAAQIVQINWSHWATGQQETLTLNLPEGETLTAEKVRLDRYENGLVWVGRVEDREDSQVTLSVVGRTMVGSIRPDGLERYILRNDADGKHVLYAIDPFILWEPLPAPPLVPPIDQAPPPAQAAACPPEDGSRVDVLVAYTAAARTQLGGTSQIQAWVNARISDMNTANADSGLPGLTMRLVRVQEVSYTESWSLDTDLTRLQTTNDGYMDDLHIARAAYKADLVALIVSRADDYCGLAYTYDGRSAAGFHPWAFSVTALRYKTTSDCGTLTLSHEMGHNFGNQHDRANAARPPYYPYAYGYQSPHSSPPFRTIMAYSCSPTYDTCPRINRWSNPWTPYQGWPTGIDHDTNPSNSADNVRSMNDTRLEIANLVVNCDDGLTPTPTRTPTMTPTTTPDTGELSLLWGKVISGGGFSLGGEYAVVAAAGQPGAGTAAGGEFSVHSGALAAAPPPAMTPTATPTTTTLPPTPTATRTPTRTTTPGAQKQVALPVVVKLYPRPVGATIHGQVRQAGAAAAGVPLSLRFHNGSSWSTAATTTTSGSGHYLFSNVPPLGANQTYYVRFGPNSTHPNRVWYWWGPDITILTAGMSASGGTFDIANVDMTSPASGAVSKFPLTFRWQTRGIAGDTYRWWLRDPASDRYWYQINTTSGGQFTVNGLPEHVQYGKEYRWSVRVYGGNNGYGESFYYRRITFQPGLAGVDVTAEGVHMGQGDEDEVYVR